MIEENKYRFIFLFFFLFKKIYFGLHSLDQNKGKIARINF